MVRMARIVVSGTPHHVTQRGGRRQRTFFSSDDYGAYLRLLGEWSSRTNVRVWAYCLMPNHVNLVLVPESGAGLATCMSQVHRRYAQRINAREGWQGHLWQERFFSTPMDESHTYVAARYIITNPVRAKLTSDAMRWPHSSLRVHLGLVADSVIAPEAFRGFSIDWQGMRLGNDDEEATERLRRHTRTGRPLGTEHFIAHVESETGLDLTLGKPGRKKAKSEIG